jgi:hypothetical protein
MAIEINKDTTKEQFQARVTGGRKGSLKITDTSSVIFNINDDETLSSGSGFYGFSEEFITVQGVFGKYQEAYQIENWWAETKKELLDKMYDSFVIKYLPLVK